MDKILPAGSNTALAYLKGTTLQRPLSVLITASLITLWTGSGVMISWMEGFRNAYQLPKIWGLVKERMIAFSLVILAGIPLTFSTVLVAFGSRIETRILFQLGHEFGPLIVLMWTMIRWLIATLTSIAVIALIYHNAVPRTQPWHSVLPGRHAGDDPVVPDHGAVRLVFAELRRLQPDLRYAGRSGGAAGVDVHGFSHHPGGRRIQRHAVPAGDAGKRAGGAEDPGGSKAARRLLTQSCPSRTNPFN